VYRKGLTPVNITVDDKGNNLRPWSSRLTEYQNKEVNIPLKNRI
jgi:hypothetical protein